MAGDGVMPRVKEPGDPLGHAMGERLKDSYKIAHPGEELIDILSAGLNGYGDFVIVGNGGQVVRVPDQHRGKLAAYLLAPLLETAPVEQVLEKQMREARAQKDLQPQFRTQARPKGGGIIAKP